MEFLIKSGLDAKEIDPKKRDWPEHSVVIFAKDGDEIAGQIMVVVQPHIEGLEIEPKFRNKMLLKQLIERAEQVIIDLKRDYAISFISDANSMEYALRLGYKPLTEFYVFTKKIEG